MNSNLFQTILTVAITISGFLTTILLALGCKDVAGAIDCSTASGPTWLIPYLVIAATVSGFLKLIIKFFQGKGALINPTIVVPKL